MYYDRLIEFVLENDLFQSNETFNCKQFQDALRKRDLLVQFNIIYLNDTNCGGRWLMWDFSDRFARFAQALCTVGYCNKISHGLYQKI